MSRSRSWCFTLNNYSEVETEYLASEESHHGITYLIYEKEVAPETGTPHLQGYVYYTQPRSLKQMKEWLKEAHFETAHGNAQQNKAYCTKTGEGIYEYGTMPQQGRRSDIKEVKEIVNRGGNMKEVCEVASSYQAMKCGELLMKYTKPPIREQPKVLWFWGPTGSGKTRRAIEIGGDDYWISARGLKWWDGYFGQKTVIIDDFRPTFCAFEELLRILDRYPYRVETKGSSTWLNATTIIITAPYEPTTYFHNGEDIKQLIRRISETVHFQCTEVPCTEVKGNTEP